MLAPCCENSGLLRLERTGDGLWLAIEAEQERGVPHSTPPTNVLFSRDSSFLMIHETQLSLSYIESPPLMILFLSPRLQPGFFSLLS